MIKFSGIILLVCICLPFALSYFALQYRKDQLRREIKWKMAEGLDRSELVLLKFTTAEAKRELRWEHSREFEYRGNMYDIVQRVQKGDSLMFWCWWDSEETIINQRLRQLVSNYWDHDPGRKNQQDRLTNFIKSLYFSEFNHQVFLPESAIPNSTAYHLRLAQNEFAPPVPPPRQV